MERKEPDHPQTPFGRYKYTFLCLNNSVLLLLVDFLVGSPHPICKNSCILLSAVNKSSFNFRLTLQPLEQSCNISTQVCVEAIDILVSTVAVHLCMKQGLQSLLLKCYRSNGY